MAAEEENMRERDDPPDIGEGGAIFNHNLPMPRSKTFEEAGEPQERLYSCD